MAKSKILVGIIGLGKIAQTQYLPALAHNVYVKIVSLCDQSASVVRQVAASYGIGEEGIATSVEQLIQRRPQLVFILTHAHEELALKLIEESINVCVEKPLCWNVKSAKEVARRALKKGVRVYACYMKQFDLTYCAFRNAVQEAPAILGINAQCYAGNNKLWCDPLFEIIRAKAREKAEAKASLNNTWNDFYSAQVSLEPWQRKASQLLLQLGIHQINILHALSEDLSVDTSLFKERGDIMTFSAMFNSRDFLVSYTMVPLFGAPWDWKEQYTVVCPDRTLEYEPGCPFIGMSNAKMRITDAQRGGGIKEYRISYLNPFALMIEEIMKSMAEDRPIDQRLSPESAIRDLQTIESALAVLRGAL